MCRLHQSATKNLDFREDPSFTSNLDCGNNFFHFNVK